MKNLKILCLLLPLFMLFSCGVRKSDTDYKKSSFEVEKSKETNNDIKETSTTAAVETSTTEKSVDNDISETKTVQKTTEVFNTDGSINKRTVTTTNHTKKDRSKIKDSEYSDKSSTKVDDFADHSQLIEKYVLDSLEITKTKTVSSDKTVVKNVGGRGMLIILFIILVVAFFAYLYIKKNKNTIKEAEHLGI